MQSMDLEGRKTKETMQNRILADRESEDPGQKECVSLRNDLGSRADKLPTERNAYFPV